MAFLFLVYFILFIFSFFHFHQITRLHSSFAFSCIWDLEANKKTTDFCAHAGDVVSISLSPDGNTYVTGSVDKTCKLWDLREETAKQTFFGHEADVNSVCVSREFDEKDTSKIY